MIAYLGNVKQKVDPSDKHTIYFFCPEIPISKNKDIPAIRIGGGDVDVYPGDTVIIFNIDKNNTGGSYFYMPLITNNKIELYSGVESEDDYKTYNKVNHIDLTSGGINGDNTTKEILIKSDNKVTINSGGTKIELDGKTGLITISASSNKNVEGEDILINGNVKIVGELNVSGDVKSFGGLYSLTNHYHIGNLAFFTTPTIPTTT